MERLLERYELINELGKGSNGMVYLARDTKLDRLVAVKAQPYRENIEKEAEFMKNINHKGLPVIYDYERIDNVVYIIMEYAEGVTLDNYIKSTGPLSEGEALKIASQVMNILGYLHGMKPAVIYRDLKPENIIINSSGEIKLIDLGGVYSKDYVNYSKEANVGTRGYSAPELWERAEATPSADIYSIGALMYFMLTNIEPTMITYSGKNIRNYMRSISLSTEKCISRCLSDNPEDRYGSIEELKAELLVKDNAFLSGAGLLLGLKKALVLLMYVWAAGLGLVPYLTGRRQLYTTGRLICILALFLGGFLLEKVLFSKEKSGGVEYTGLQQVWLSQKKYIGLYGLMLFTAGMVFSLILGAGISGSKVYALGETKDMWVDMLDAHERKVLLKEDGLYEVSGKILFEIPEGQIPGEEIHINITAMDENGKLYESRNFNVINREG